jgi:hypothetical protein
MSSTIDASFNSQDMETLLEAMDIWESNGTIESTVLDYVKKIPVPKENKEAAKYIGEIKEFWVGQEKDILSRRDVIREKAIFLKAKLMQAKITKGIDQLFNTPDSVAAEAQATPTLPVKKGKLRLAEEFIRDLGVWSHYEKFLEDRKNTSPE